MGTGSDVLLTTASQQPQAGKPQNGSNNLLQRPLWLVREQLRATFLPSGYLATVGPGYLPFVWWQAVHHAASSANGVLASTFMLYSVGLGAGAIPTAGAINWVLKDGLGQLGTLLFGKTIAHRFDINTKSWYLMASAKLDVAIGLEICTLLCPPYFLVMGAGANMLKGLAWMAGGSTRSAFNVSFARDNNIADITAKATSQTICTSLLGTTAGLSLASAIGQSIPAALGAYTVLTSVHLYSAYRCVQSIPLTSLNPSRLEALCEHFLDAVPQPGSRAVLPDALSTRQPFAPQQESSTEAEAMRSRAPWKAQQGGSCERATTSQEDPDEPGVITLPGPIELAATDPVVPWPERWRDPGLRPSIRVGTPIAKLHQLPGDLLAMLVDLHQTERHLLIPGGGHLHLVLHTDAEPVHSLQAYLHACLFRRILRKQASSGHQLPTTKLQAAVTASLIDSKLCVPQFRQRLVHAGWATNKIVIEPKRCRGTW
ncbi:hypothetical protein WJX72_000733 [[Myrmecia] bisecta]|uniref:Uncharacterized protein n=1 Tax=[Myrmecia] bisecta TaxID=41462 RepID=A0AAW1Q385_9CHLO